MEKHFTLEDHEEILEAHKQSSNAVAKARENYGEAESMRAGAKPDEVEAADIMVRWDKAALDAAKAEYDQLIAEAEAIGGVNRGTNDELWLEAHMEEQRRLGVELEKFEEESKRIAERRAALGEEIQTCIIGLNVEMILAKIEMPDWVFEAVSKPAGQKIVKTIFTKIYGDEAVKAGKALPKEGISDEQKDGFWKEAVKQLRERLVSGKTQIIPDNAAWTGVHKKKI
jgi:hypothetical protein